MERLSFGGDFTTVNQVPVPRVARLNSDGTLDLGLDLPVPGGTVYCSTQLPDGTVIVGGDFGIATSVVSPVNNQAIGVNSPIPFAALIVSDSLDSVKEVRFLSKGPGEEDFRLLDVQTAPLASTRPLGHASLPGHI